MEYNNTSMSDNNYYPLIVKKSVEDDEMFKIFKSHEWYTPILEHVSEYLGQQYLEKIKSDYPFILKNITKYRTNDSIGSPSTYNYIEIGSMSPTTLRYMKVLGDLSKNFGSLNDLDIVEIGCGYGGQCKIIMDTYNVNSYTFIDLPSVLELTKKYLSYFGYDMNKFIFKDISNLTENEKYDLFISNYAYTECSENIRDIYLNKIILKSKMGYITSNFLSKETMTNEIVNKINNCYITDEVPLTGSNNFIILWDN